VPDREAHGAITGQQSTVTCAWASIENIYCRHWMYIRRDRSDQRRPNQINRQWRAERVCRVFINLSGRFRLGSSIQPMDTGEFGSDHVSPRWRKSSFVRSFV